MEIFWGSGGNAGTTLLPLLQQKDSDLPFNSQAKQCGQVEDHMGGSHHEESILVWVGGSGGGVGLFNGILVGVDGDG